MADPIFTYCPVCATALIEQPVAHARRSVCPHCHFILFLNPELVAIVVVHQEHKLLLGKRNIEPGKGLWSFFGGYVERGEKVEEAAVREVKEETNLDVQLEGLVGLYSERGDSHVLIVYQASILNNQMSTLALQHEEVSELALFAWEELPHLRSRLINAFCTIGKSSGTTEDITKICLVCFNPRDMNHICQ